MKGKVLSRDPCHARWRTMVGRIGRLTVGVLAIVTSNVPECRGSASMETPAPASFDSAEVTAPTISPTPEPEEIEPTPTPVESSPTPAPLEETPAPVPTPSPEAEPTPSPITSDTPAPVATEAPVTPSTPVPASSLVDLFATLLSENTGDHKGDFDLFIAALSEVSLDEKLDGGGPFTVFAPTDAAFGFAGVTGLDLAALPPSTLENLLLYHIVSGELNLESVEGLDEMFMLSGGSVEVSGTKLTDALGSTTTIGDSDIEASNGYLHIIDGLLQPVTLEATPAPTSLIFTPAPSAALVDIVDTLTESNTGGEGKGLFDTFISLLEMSGMGATLTGTGPFTVFAPTDSAFSSAGLGTEDLETLSLGQLEGMVEYLTVEASINVLSLEDIEELFTLQGSLMTVDGTKLTGTQGADASIVVEDLQASNGYVHGIDAVILPFTLSPTPAPTGTLAPMAIVDIFSTAEAMNTLSGGEFEGQFDTFLGAVALAGLERRMQAFGPLTVFIPTDAAFAAAGLGPAVLTLMSVDILENILLYHLVAADLTLESIEGITELFTVYGPEILVDKTLLTDTQDGVAEIISLDIQASNGYVHVIDGVLLPFPLGPTPAPTAVIWTGPPTIPIVDIVATLTAANGDSGDNTGMFDALLTAVEVSGLGETLEGIGPLTLLAPTDRAFFEVGLDATSLSDLPPTVVEKLLLYHIVDSGASTETLSKLDALFTMLGINVVVSYPRLYDTQNDVSVFTGVNMTASNGFIHAVDAVLFPPDLVGAMDSANAKGASYDGLLDPFIRALNLTGLTDDLEGLNGPYTLFAPSYYAFEGVGVYAEEMVKGENLEVITRYHIVPGSLDSQAVAESDTLTTLSNKTITVTRGLLYDELGNGASLAGVDIVAVNGYIHIIDAVLEPYEIYTPSPTAVPTLAPTVALLDIVDTLEDVNTRRRGESYGVFDVMLNAIAASGSESAYKMLNMSYTVFAPTDDAFAKANLTISNIADQPPIALYNILQYHTLSAGLNLLSLEGIEDELFTLLGLPVKVIVDDVGVGIVDSEGAVGYIERSNITASNGIIHAIDSVLSTPDMLSTLSEYNAKGGRFEGLFDTFIAAMDLTNKENFLTSKDAFYTVFAPTDDAFGAMDIDETTITLLDSTELSELLNFHMVPGLIPSSQLEEESPMKTLMAGQNISVNGLVVTTPAEEEVKISAADIIASNGVFHVVGNVMFPSEEMADTFRGFVTGQSATSSSSSALDKLGISIGIAAAVLLCGLAGYARLKYMGRAQDSPVFPEDRGPKWTGGGGMDNAPNWYRS